MTLAFAKAKPRLFCSLTLAVRLIAVTKNQASSNGRTSGRLPEDRGSNPRAWTNVDEVLSAARRLRKAQARVRSPPSAPLRPASWCGHSARLKSERTWFDSTAGHHSHATNAQERSCPVSSKREFDAPWWLHRTNRRLVKWRSREPPKLEVAVRLRGRRPPPRRLMA